MFTPSSLAADCARTAPGLERNRIGFFRFSRSRLCSAASSAPDSSHFIRTENRSSTVSRRQAHAARLAFANFLQDATKKKFVVYAKRPFAGPGTVLANLARYTHRIGITNHRILAIDASTHTVTFDFKDYADGAKHTAMALTCEEFVRRVVLLILPERFVA